MSLGQSLSIGAVVGIYAPGGRFLYPALVSLITVVGNSRLIGGTAFPAGGVADMPIQNINHRSLTVDGSGWDFPSALPSFAL
jgi:hypothetical protein